MIAAEHLASITQQIQAANVRTLAENLATALAEIDALKAELESLKPKPAGAEAPKAAPKPEAVSKDATDAVTEAEAKRIRKWKNNSPCLSPSKNSARISRCAASRRTAGSWRTRGTRRSRTITWKKSGRR